MGTLLELPREIESGMGKRRVKHWVALYVIAADVMAEPCLIDDFPLGWRKRGVVVGTLVPQDADTFEVFPPVGPPLFPEV